MKYGQMRLLEHSRKTRRSDFEKIYTDSALYSRLAHLESSISIANEEDVFGNLVNTTFSRNDPYDRWARYREAYSGRLVKQLIQQYEIDPDNQFVFDPMCGSGSTLVAAAQTSIDSLGLDVNPYAVDLTNAKTTHYSLEDIDQTKDFVRKPFLTDSVPSVALPEMELCQPYFESRNLDTLRLIRKQIATVPMNAARNLLLTAWLAILEDCSERAKGGNGLVSRRSKVRDVWTYFRSRVDRFIADLRFHPLPIDAKAIAYRASAKNAKFFVEEFEGLAKKKLGAVIFSPPYANSFDYFESYKLELLAEYYDLEELAKARGEAVRNYRKGGGHDLRTNDELVQMLCREIVSKIPKKEARTGRVDGRSRLVPNLLIGYFTDMERVIEELAACMPQASLCHIVVDRSSYLGVPVPTDLILANIAMRHGFGLDKLTYCRRSTTSAQQLREFPHLVGVLRKSILTLERS